MSRRGQPSQLARNLRRARHATGFTQAAVARVLQSTDQYVSDLERGARIPSLHYLALLSCAYRTPVAKLLERVRASELMKE